MQINAHLEHGRQDGALQRAPAGHGLVRVQRRARLLPEHLLNERLDGGDAGATAHNLHADGNKYFEEKCTPQNLE